VAKRCCFCDGWGSTLKGLMVPEFPPGLSRASLHTSLVLTSFALDV